IPPKCCDRTLAHPAIPSITRHPSVSPRVSASQRHPNTSTYHSIAMSASSTKKSRAGFLAKSIIACCASSVLLASAAQAASSSPITTVFYVLLENRCFTSGTDTSYSNILFQNKNGAAPYLTALCTPGSAAYTVNYQGNVISQTAHSSFCSCYHHVFATYNNT